MRIMTAPISASRGYEKQGAAFAYGYEGRKCVKPPGLHYGRKRGVKVTRRKKRGWGDRTREVTYVIRPSWRS